MGEEGKTERQQAEEALRESEERFRTMANVIPQLAWIARSDGHIFWYNQRWYEYTGTTPEEMEGWGWQSVHDPKMLPQVLEQWRASIATGKPFDMVFPLRGGDGQFRPFLTRVNPIKDADGQVIQWFGTNTDITERQQAEEALQRQQEELQIILDSVPAMIFYKDKENRFIRTNKALAAAMGLPKEEMDGKSVFDLYPFQADDYWEDDQEVMRRGNPKRNIVETLETLEGVRWVQTDKIPYRDDQGNIIGVIGFSVDITERKRAEEALRRLNEELEKRVQERTEELRLMVVHLEREVGERRLAEDQAHTIGRLYRVLSKVNEAIVRAEDQETLFQQACRIAVDDGLFRMAWIGLIDPADRVLKAAVQYGFENGYLESLMIPLEDVPEGRGPTGVAAREGSTDVCNDFAHDPRMAPWREKAMARGYQSSAALPLRLGGAVVGALTLYAEQPGFFTTEEIALLESMAGDLSFAMESIEREAKRRQAEEEIRGLNEELDLRVKKRTAELEFANRELESFSYSVSHDLRAPLRAIQGFSRMLMAEHAAQLNAEGLRLLNVITTNTKLMTALIDDLLALSRLGRHEIRKGSFNLTAMARQVFEQLKSQEPGRDLQFIIKDLPPTHGDPSLIRQVLVNLLANAVKYTKQRKTAVIEVGGNDAAKENIYYIKDNGVGFDARYADKLFGVFHRLHGGEEYEGTGVGLAIVKRIIERHGGRVWAEGKVNEGATFYFSLPKNDV